MQKQFIRVCQEPYDNRLVAFLKSSTARARRMLEVGDWLHARAGRSRGSRATACSASGPLRTSVRAA